jgi:large subunit ribosomal protein L15
MKLSSLKPNKGSVKKDTRLGRGHGSGGGGTAKRGHNGAQSRSGYSRKLGFEGGQMPLQRRLPKFGFNNINRVEYKAINLDTLQALIDSTGAKTIDLGLLYSNGLIAKSDLVKILGRGEVTTAVEVRVNGFSKSAVEAIEKAGGTAVVDATLNKKAPTNAVKTEADVPKKEKKVAKKEKQETAPEAVAPANEEVALATPVEEVSKEKPKATKKSTPKSDDLRKVEGIGPKIAELFNNAGIITFADLAATSVEKLNEILEEAGPRYSIHNPTTWPQQAQLASEGKWDELSELKNKLDGGRPE